MKTFLTCISCFIFMFMGCSSEKEESIPGGYTSVSVTDKDVVAAAAFAVKKQAAVKPSKITLVKIISASQQVVAGLNFHLKLRVKVDGVEKDATVVVYRDLSNVHSLTSWVWKSTTK